MGSNMTPLPDTTQSLKTLIRRPSAPGADHFFYLEGFCAALDEPFEIREARARLHFYQNVPIRIHPGEAIVGQIDWNEPLVTQVANTHLRPEVLERLLAGDLSQAEKARLQEMVHQAQPFCFDPWAHLSPEEKLVQESHLAPSTFFNGHMVPDFVTLLSRGLGGQLELIQQAQTRKLSPVQRNFYTAMEITTRGLSAYITRYAALAEDLLAETQLPDGFERLQLEHIAAACRRLAWNPARNFPEALQMTWFLMCFVDYDSFGRSDQYLYPYYQASRSQGMEENEACLWLKFMLLKVEECGGILNLTIGGRQADGTSAVNPLTYLILQAVRQLGFRSPNLSLRLRASDPERLWQEAHCSLATGQGLPALYNDDLIVPMLERLGYPLQEAYDYCLAGCSQVILPGRSNFACDVGCYNLAKALELALHDGYDVLLGKQVGPHTGSASHLENFEQLKAAYDIQVRYMTRLGVAINNKDAFLRQSEGACVRSLVSRDCLERGRGFFHGGARFYNIQNEATGITNAANALYALKKLVYEQLVLPLSELVGILDHNWQGHEGLRLRFLNGVAKFGNDCVEVDELRAALAGDWYRELQQYPGALGGIHWPGEVVFVYHEWHGGHTAASADGRLCGEPLASSAGASSGTDLNGPAALLKSMLRLPQSECLTCCVLNLRFSRQTWSDNPAALLNLLRTYFAQGGYQVQVNLVSRAELLAARLHPEQYADLVVRVGGFSDYYVRLNEGLQLEILARTEHNV